jgi:hypothetical protein
MKNALGYEHEPGSPETQPADDETSARLATATPQTGRPGVY